MPPNVQLLTVAQSQTSPFYTVLNSAKHQTLKRAVTSSDLKLLIKSKFKKHPILP